MSPRHSVCLMTSQSSAYYDLSWTKAKHRPLFTKEKFGSLGDFCSTNELPLPNEIDEVFSQWEGPLNQLLAGPVIEVTNLYNTLLENGHDVNYWCLTYDCKWKNMGDVSHPLWTSDDSWKSTSPSLELIQSMSDADIIISTIPATVLISNSELRFKLEKLDNLVLCCASSIKGKMMMNEPLLLIPTRGLARIGKEGAEKILSLINNHGFNKV